ncbi:PAS domain-containing sensor histidine kinase [Hymenobacter sp. UV11]|uniref:PAS domain-containing protein n=1 Tax=Hymenobacter sp. UV11 TaxID=1849735 RepID=UPI00105C8896|nr:PAS domain-containing protein [Hymenobacter sp. UV11]TDN40225.1 hypothetical protein A8B98_15205 [Hymenobacter sp. UV11]TFZ64916.1 PAS domain-containing sensor histidine kinase [Hymenobacter sp. UV11]
MNSSAHLFTTESAVPAALLQALETGVVYFSPVYADGNSEKLLTLAFEQVSPLAQRLLGLPEFAEGTVGTLLPQAAGFAEFCNATFQSDEVGHYALPPTNQHQPGWRAVAQRQGQQLVMAITEAALPPRTERLTTTRPPALPAAGQLAAAEPPTAQVLMQAPVAVCLLRGPHYELSYSNAAFDRLLAGRVAAGRPITELLPQLITEALLPILNQVSATGEPYSGFEKPLANSAGQTTYLNLTFQAYQPAGEPAGILVVGYDVTRQVLARRQVHKQKLSRRLHATYEELRTNYHRLAHTQQQVQQLNQELEARVAAGVAEAQQARAEAERERHRLESFFRQSPAAICVLNGPELVYELVNPTYQQRFPGRQLLGLPLLDALPEFTGHATVARLRDVYATGITHEGSEVMLAVARVGDGQVEAAYFDCVYQARFDEQGVIDGVLVFALDVTAKVRAQRRATDLQAQVLRAAQRQAQALATFHQVFDQTSAAILFLRGADFKLEYANQAYERLIPGVAQIGRPLAEVLKNTRPQGFMSIMNQVYQTGRPYVGNEVPVEVALFGGPPLTKYLNFTYQAVREEKQIVGLSIFAYDVTEQVLGRQQREEGQAQLQAAFEQAPVALALLDGPDYIIRVVNPAILAFSQQQRDEVLGRPLFEVWPLMRNQGYPELLAELRRTGTPYMVEEQLVEFQRAWGNQQLYFHFVLQPMLDAQGQVTSIMLIANEITQQVNSRQQLAEANNALRATNAQLTRTNTDLDNFIYTASHDLKAPISNIESLLLMLRQQLPAEARQAGMVPKVLRMMEDAIGRFQLTIAHLTDLSRLQQAHSELAETVSLETTIEAVRLDLASELRATGAQLTVDVSDCPTILLAPHHLRSVVYNLLSNALKYRHPDRVPEVRVRCHMQAGMSVLTVEDNGLGLSAPQQQKIFGLFRRLHAHVDGSGVGLYMVKRIVENAGGTIAVHSTMGAGSAFLVSLPTALPPSLT